MALLVWLPLNGDLNNLGLKNIDIFSSAGSGTTFNMAGKIGQCLTLNDKVLYSPNFSISTTSFSAFCWIKFISLPSSSNAYLICLNGSTSSDMQFCLGVYRGSSGNATLRFNVGNDCGSLTTDTWYHLGFTYDSAQVKMYINGVCEKTFAKTSATAATNLVIGGRSSNAAGTSSTGRGAPGYYNDVRIYDHALSDKEVEELARGLVLHYLLNNNGIGKNNILINTDFFLRYSLTSGWNTTKNGTLLANSWGGYNSGVSNLASVYHAHLKLFNNEYVYEYIKTASESWLGISLGGLQTKLIAGKTYTFSWEEYHVDGTNRVGTGLYYFQPGATSANFHLGIQQATNITRVLGLWLKFSYTFTAPSTSLADYNKGMTWYIYGHYNGNGTFYLRHPKLEEGDSATSWYLAPTDSNYINNSIIYDSSGYNNHGNIVGQIENFNISPKYFISTYINSPDPTTNSATGEYYISANCELTTPSTISISWWASPESGYGNTINHAMWSTTANDIASDYLTSAFNHRDTRFDVNSSDGLHLALSTSSFTANAWHHYVVTYDGQTAKLYRDGILQTSVAFTTAKTLGTFTKILIGHSRAGGVHRKMKGKYSDFRVYVTALSADQIKELYRTSLIVDGVNKIPRDLE